MAYNFQKALDSGLTPQQITNYLATQGRRKEAEDYFGVVQKKPNYFQRLGKSFKEGFGKIKEGFNQASVPNGPLQGFEAALKIGAGAVEAATSPITAAVEPIVEPTLGKGIKAVANEIAKSEKVQKFANSKAGDITERVVEDIANLNTIAGAVVGPKAGKVGTAKVGNLVKTTGRNVAKKAAGAKSLTNDLVPSLDRVVNHQVTNALELTQGDVKNIFQSTGNEVGKFMAKNNLIGKGKDATVSNLQKFYDDNYAAVRSEIDKVKTPYKPSQIPRYTEALKQVKGKVDGVPGLQKVSVEVENLLNKKSDITLSDVQRVKELIDDHFTLYKVTGDVGEGVAKEGLSNIRKDLRVFIEQEVKKNGGADIAKLNNNVSTAKSTLDAVNTRATRGLTRGNIGLSDLGVFGSGTMAGGPLVGLALVFAKKIIDSPSVQLRLAKYLDKISDAKKAKIKADLEAGKVPVELKRLLDKPKSKSTSVK